MAQLLKVDGTFADLIPTNGRNFTLTEDIYPLLKTRVVQQIALTDRRVMLMDENAKLRKNPEAINPKATALLFAAGGMRDDCIIGDVVIMSKREARAIK